MLANGNQVSWMNVVDEASTSPLGAKVFEVRTVSQIPLLAAIRSDNDLFSSWGLPAAVKIDNGRPFVNPRSRDVPTLAMLWWTGLGIKVIQNTPRCPQENGGVECSQGILCRWSNAKGQPSSDALQQRLDEEAAFQRNDFKIRAKNNQTRATLYPNLEYSGRPYDPRNFNLARVDAWLADGLWQRKIRQNGEVRIFGHLVYAGQRYSGQSVDVIFDPIERQWLIALANGTLIQKTSKGVPTKASIQGLILNHEGSTTTSALEDTT
jgi:hypothetical protein